MDITSTIPVTVNIVTITCWEKYLNKIKKNPKLSGQFA